MQFFKLTNWDIYLSQNWKICKVKMQKKNSSSLSWKKEKSKLGRSYSIKHNWFRNCNRQFWSWMCTTKMNKTSLAHKWLMATPKKTKTLYQLETRQSQARRSGKWSKISQWTKTTTASPAIPKTHSLLMSQEYLAKTQTNNNLKSYLIRWIYWFQIMKQRQLRIWQKGVKH